MFCDILDFVLVIFNFFPKAKIADGKELIFDSECRLTPSILEITKSVMVNIFFSVELV